MTEIAERARFDLIRYAQLWEDADVLTAAMGDKAGGTLVSICAAGDNALALLTLDPAHVYAVDLSEAQLDCLRLRIGAFRTLEHDEFLRLMGARPGDDRGELLDRAIHDMRPDSKAFWQHRRDDVIAHGAGGVGKFERYFRIFARHILPLAHSRATVEALLTPMTREEREVFLKTRWNTFRWRLMLNVFFSRFMMGRMGRDKAFFDHVQGSPAAHVGRRISHAVVDTDPSQNPYLHWVMTGTHGEALPMTWRAEHYETIRDRLDRLELRKGPLEDVEAQADGYNLSDIFEYMSPDGAAEVYGRLLDKSNPGARLVYWNMMAPRRVPDELATRVQTLTELEDRLKAIDKAFFYSDFVIEEVL